MNLKIVKQTVRDDSNLTELARVAGIACVWTDNDGVERTVSIETLRYTLESLGLACSNDPQIAASRKLLQQRACREILPPLVTAWIGEPINLPWRFPDNPRASIEYETGARENVTLMPGPGGTSIVPAIVQCGYHRLSCAGQSMTMAIAPRRCWTFDDVAGGQKLWGLAAQTYGLYRLSQSADIYCDSAIGTFADAGELAARAARQGADALMISPAHALFHADADHFSPYSPSSRFFYNALLCDPASVFDDERLRTLAQATKPDMQDKVLCGEGLINWPRETAIKQRLLRALYDSFLRRELADATNALAINYNTYKSEGGALLARHALFEVIHTQQFSANPDRWHWREWPGELRSCEFAGATPFARSHARDVDYHIFLQWLTRRSFEAAQKKALHAGMRIGLINDLAVGVNTGGSHAWSMPDDLLQGLSIGAPPDVLAPRGQNWGLTTFSPFALQDNGFATFLATLRASLGPAGGVRIDHVMGLMRLWLIPDGAESSEGVYVSYPFDDMLRLTALESYRARKVVIGEDLGTVPAGIREQLNSTGLAGMRVVLFEKDGDEYRPPGHYPSGAIAMTTTHDTATVTGWQRGSDIDLRAPLDQLPPGETVVSAQHMRAFDRNALWRAFAAAGLAPSVDGHMTDREREPRFTAAAIAFAAQTRAQFVAVPLEDISASVEQPNLPGTTNEHPNWRRRYSKPVETILTEEPAAGHIALLQLARQARDNAAE